MSALQTFTYQCFLETHYSRIACRPVVMTGHLATTKATSSFAHLDTTSRIFDISCLNPKLSALFADVSNIISHHVIGYQMLTKQPSMRMTGHLPHRRIVESFRILRPEESFYGFIRSEAQGHHYSFLRSLKQLKDPWD